jgi:hypothetical protein
MAIGGLMLDLRKEGCGKGRNQIKRMWEKDLIGVFKQATVSSSNPI